MKVNVNAQQAFRKLARVRMQVWKARDATVETLGNLGKNYAKSIAPYYTGKTANMIFKTTIQTINGKECHIVAPNSTPDRKDNFNLVRWMHLSPRAKYHIHSGDPRFMFSTGNYLNTIKKRVIWYEFDKIRIV
jgi:hypothetical protein